MVKIKPTLPTFEEDESVSKLKSHGVFSDVSHMALDVGGLEATKFALSLRQEDSDFDEIISKILPLTKIVPGIDKSAKPIRVTLGVCQKQECILNRERLKAVKLANEPFSNQFNDKKNQLLEMKSRLGTFESEIQSVKEQNQQLQTKIEERRIAIEQLKATNAKLETSNSSLNFLLKDTTERTEDLRCKFEQAEKDMSVFLHSQERVVIRFPKQNKEQSKPRGRNRVYRCVHNDYESDSDEEI
jgi:chromosome segregation ATPase